jgi:hypothetical protein
MRQVGAGGRLEPLRLQPNQKLMLLATIVEVVGNGTAVIGTQAGGQTIQIPSGDYAEYLRAEQAALDALELEAVEA